MSDGNTMIPSASCPACGSGDIVMADDFIRDVTIFKCQNCGETFAVPNEDAYNHGESWAFNEWANSFASQNRLYGKVVER